MTQDTVVSIVSGHWVETMRNNMLLFGDKCSVMVRAEPQMCIKSFDCIEIVCCTELHVTAENCFEKVNVCHQL